MTNPDEVKPCIWCEGQTKRFQMKTADGAIVEMVEHQGWPHCCVRRDSMTLAQWNFRRPPVVTDEVVERVARAIALSDYPSQNIVWPGDFGPQERLDYYDNARAALASMPAVVSGGQSE